VLPECPSPSPDPSRTGLEDVAAPEGSATTERVARTEGDFAVTNPRLPSPEQLSRLAAVFQDLIHLKYPSDADLTRIHVVLWTLYTPRPTDLVSSDVFDKNLPTETCRVSVLW
jgi:hypothetical protein